jgi:hypothetical protein
MIFFEQSIPASDFTLIPVKFLSVQKSLSLILLLMPDRALKRIFVQDDVMPRLLLH